MHVGEDESFYRPVNISDNDWRDIVYFQQADGVMLVEGTALAVIKYQNLYRTEAINSRGRILIQEV